jgi:hypothetical protein
MGVSRIRTFERSSRPSPFASVKLEEYNLEKTSKTHGYLYRGIAAK